MGFFVNRYHRATDGGDFYRVTDRGPASSRGERQPETEECRSCHGGRSSLLMGRCRACQGLGVVAVITTRR